MTDGKASVEFMFRKKLRTVFNRMLPMRRIDRPRNEMSTYSLQVGENVVIKSYQSNSKWETGILEWGL